MYQVNMFCNAPGFKGTNMTAMIAGLWGHEGFGINGGIGHETLGQEAAGLPENDPWKAIENLYYPDAVTLSNEVDARVLPIAERITLAARDDVGTGGGPRGNWQPAPGEQVYFWMTGGDGQLKWVVKPFLDTY